MKFHYDVSMKNRTSLYMLRHERRITQDRLVLRIATELPDGRTMSQARYSQIENGVGKEPDKDEKNAVAAALGVKASDIAWYEFSARTA